jgi:hypothetical protein
LEILPWCTYNGEIAVFFWEEKLVAPLIATPNGDCANEKTKDRAKKLGYRLRM